MKTILSATAFFLGLATLLPANDWPQWLGESRDGIWREEGILKKFPEGGPKLVWKIDGGSGYAGPAVSKGRVFVMDRALKKEAKSPDNPFKRGEIPGTERVRCLDSATGEGIWEHVYESNYTVSYAAGPRATPTVDGDHVYALGAEGRLHCLKTADGAVVWAKDFVKDFGVKTPTWGFAGAPLVVGDLVICLMGGDGSVAIAFDKKTGAEKWRALSAKEPGYCPPTLIEHGGKRQLIVWHPESVNALDPQTGKVLWTFPWQLRSGLSVATPQLGGDHLLLTAFYNGGLVLKLKPDQSMPEKIWQTEKVSEKRTTHINSIMGTPYIVDGHLYGICSYGEFRCLELASGKRIWESMDATTGKERKARWANVFVTPHADRYFLFNERGELIIANLSTEGYAEIDRATIIEPNGSDMRQRKIVWAHPAYAEKRIFVRNDTEVRCYSLAE